MRVLIILQTNKFNTKYKPANTAGDDVNITLGKF